MRCSCGLVSSLMTDYANLSSKLSIANRVNSENDDSDGDPLGLAFRSLHFCSASQTLFAS